MRPISLTVEMLAKLPGMRLAGRVLARAAIHLSALLERSAPHLPLRVALWLFTFVDKLAGIAGHLLYSPDGAEPSPSGLLGERLPRD